MQACLIWAIVRINPANIYLFKLSNRNTRKRCKICSNLTIEAPEWRQTRRSGIFIANFEHISHLFLVFLLLIWKNKNVSLEISFEVFSLNNVLINTIFAWLLSAIKQLLRKFHFEFLHTFNLTWKWSKEASSCRYNIVTFRHNIAYVVNSFVVP